MYQMQRKWKNLNYRISLTKLKLNKALDERLLPPELFKVCSKWWSLSPQQRVYLWAFNFVSVNANEMDSNTVYTQSCAFQPELCFLKLLLKAS